ncbi:MAG: AAA family ATPase [Thermodesulfobacteriota bacterium]
MWVQEIAIEHFGAANGLRIDGLGPGVTVIFGPNEAGKSTVLEFVRSVLFGFRKKSGRLNIYEPPEGTLRSGWLLLSTDRGHRLRLTRTERRGQREGWLSVTDEAGGDEYARWADLLHNGLDRAAYENLFAFGLEGLRTLDRVALRDKILAAAVGSAGTSPLQVLKRIDEAAKRLLKRPIRDGDSISILQDRIRQIDRRLRELADKPERYFHLRDRLEAIAQERSALQRQIREAEVSLSVLSTTLRYEEKWKRLLHLERELNDHRDGHRFPQAGLSRLDELLERQREAEDSLREIVENVQNLRQMRERLQPDEALLEHEQEIRQLSAQAKAISGTEEEILRLKERARRLETLVSEEIATLGRAWTRERADATDPSIALEQEIRVFAESRRKLDERVSALKHRLTEASEQCERLRATVRQKEERLEYLAPLCRGFLAGESLAGIQQWRLYRQEVSTLQERLVSERRRVLALAQEHRELSTSIAFLDEQSGALASPGLFRALMALLFGTGIVVAGLGWPFSDLRAVGNLMAGLTMCSCVPFVIRWKSSWESRQRKRLTLEKEALGRKLRLTSREIAHIEQSRRNIKLRIQDLEIQLGRLASDVLGNRAAGLSEILEAEARSRSAEQPAQEARAIKEALRMARGQLDAVQNQKRELIGEIELAESELNKLNSRWNSLMARHLFGETVSPETAISVVLRLRGIKGKLRDLEAEERELDRLTAKWEALSTAVSSLLSPMGRAEFEAGLSLLDRVEALARASDESQRMLAEKNTLAERIREQELRSGVLSQRLLDIRDRIARLFSEAGVTSEEDFRQRSTVHEVYATLQQERRLLIFALTAGLGFEDEAALREHMGRIIWSESRAEATELTALLANLRNRSEELGDLNGRIAQEVELLEAEEETDVLLHEKEVLLAQLQKLTREWIVKRLSSEILRRTLKRYESEKQPKIVEKGSEIFRTVTGGKFTRILFPLEEDAVKAERADGRIVDESILSTGSLEQVYLSLRLAHVETLGQEEPFPLLLDDILVNFDQVRAARTAEALVKFSERTGTQVLFFTCHVSIADLFPDSVHQVSLVRIPTS